MAWHTWPLRRNRPRPSPGSPRLLLMMVRSRAPEVASTSRMWIGAPTNPKPPTMTVAPLGTRSGTRSIGMSLSRCMAGAPYSMMHMVAAVGVCSAPLEQRHTIAETDCPGQARPELHAQVYVRYPTAKAGDLPPAQRAETMGRLTAARQGRIYRDWQGVCCGRCGQR